MTATKRIAIALGNVAAATTPDEYLLAEFDRQVVNPLRKPGTHERPLLELIEDHEADPERCGYCNPPLYP